MADPSLDQGNKFSDFILLGHNLTTTSPMPELEQARQALRDLIEEDEDVICFPIPATMPVELMVIFYYPIGVPNPNPSIMDRLIIARELTQGILYQDHSSVTSKSVSVRETSQEEGFTEVRVRVIRPYGSN